MRRCQIPVACQWLSGPATFKFWNHLLLHTFPLIAFFFHQGCLTIWHNVVMHKTFTQYLTKRTLSDCAAVWNSLNLLAHNKNLSTWALGIWLLGSLNSMEAEEAEWEDWDWSAVRQWLCRSLSVSDFLRSPSLEPKGHINFRALMRRHHVFSSITQPPLPRRNDIWRCTWFVWNPVACMIGIKNKPTQTWANRWIRTSTCGGRQLQRTWNNWKAAD